MRDLYRSPLFRLLVCLVLVCSLLINLSPIRAKATSVVAGLTITELLTLLTMVVAGGAGVYWTFDTFDQAVDTIGTKIHDQIVIDDEGPGDEDALDHLVNLTDNINGMWNGDGSGFDPNLGTKIARALLGYIAAFVGASIITGGLTAEGEEETAPEGYAYYNGVLIPIIPLHKNYTYNVLSYHKESSTYYCIRSSIALYCNDTVLRNPESTRLAYSEIVHDPAIVEYVWKVSQALDGTYYCYRSLSDFDIIWADYDLLRGDGSLYLAASEPVYVSTETTTIEPIYVGDIPDQIQNGDYTDEEKEELLLAPLPEYLDITKVMQSPATAYEDYLALQQKVLDGELTPQEALNQMSGESTGTGTDPSEPTETPEEDPEVSLGLSDLTLDLSDYFPFCIPFDLYDFFACLNADPVAPVIAWQIPVPGGEPYPLELDLSVFDEVAQLLRRLQLLLFCVGLAFKTRDLIKG